MTYPLQVLAQIEAQVAALRAHAAAGGDRERAFKVYAHSWLFAEAQRSLHRLLTEIDETIEEIANRTPVEAALHAARELLAEAQTRNAVLRSPEAHAAVLAQIDAALARDKEIET